MGNGLGLLVFYLAEANYTLTNGLVEVLIRRVDVNLLHVFGHQGGEGVDNIVGLQTFFPANIGIWQKEQGTNDLW